MRIRLIAAGTRLPDWANTATAEFVGRLPPEMPVELIEVPVAKRGKNPDIARLRRQEGERMLQAAAGAAIVALDVRGKPWSTEQLSERLEAWRQGGRDLAFLIGGPDGLDAACLDRADARWSLSPLTLPHALARVVAAEALYRAWTVLQGHPYHRA